MKFVRAVSNHLSHNLCPNLSILEKIMKRIHLKSIAEMEQAAQNKIPTASSYILSKAHSQALN